MLIKIGHWPKFKELNHIIDWKPEPSIESLGQCRVIVSSCGYRRHICNSKWGPRTKKDRQSNATYKRERKLFMIDRVDVHSTIDRCSTPVIDDDRLSSLGMDGIRTAQLTM